MKDILLIFYKEWVSFFKSDRSVFLVYSLVILAWSFLLAGNLDSISSDTGMLWLVFFSVIVSGNISHSIFMHERMNGSLEILLTSGFCRSCILFGKILFVVLISIVMGIVCYSGGLIITTIRNESARFSPASVMVMKHLAVYSTACVMNASCGAWLSFRMNNPRLLHFFKFLILGFIIVSYELLAVFLPVTPLYLMLFLLLLGVLFGIGAYKSFKHEKVLQPVVF